ncbi:MAG TPA: hypothetical protein VFH68_14990 [Polyangia bacterium]|nr:hypothetical protein [Polyangia bacterium]
MTLPPERQRDLVAQLISPWVPAGAAEEARFLAAVRRATEALRSPFALADSYEIGPSDLLITNPDGKTGWTTTFGFIEPPAAAPATTDRRRELAGVLLTIWKRLFVEVRGEYGFVSVREEVVTSKASLSARGLPDVLWANLFGPRVVKAIGEEVVMSVPAEAVERLAGAGVIVIRDPDPWTWNQSLARGRRTEIRSRLGETLFVRRGWLSGKVAPARSPIDLGARSLSPMTITAPAGRYLGADPAALFSDPDARRRALAALLGTTVAALGCGRQQAESWDERRPWENVGEGERASWVAPLAFHIGDCVAGARAGKWAVHPELREPVVQLPDGRFLRPLLEAQDVVFDRGRVEEVLTRAGALPT